MENGKLRCRVLISFSDGGGAHPAGSGNNSLNISNGLNYRCASSIFFLFFSPQKNAEYIQLLSIRAATQQRQLMLGIPMILQ